MKLSKLILVGSLLGLLYIILPQYAHDPVQAYAIGVGGFISVCVLIYYVGN